MPNPNLLLVEGKDELYTIPFFMDRFVEWGRNKGEWVVEIKEQGGVKELLKRRNFNAASKTFGLKALGVILDADDEFDSRWARVRELCRAIDPDFPNDLPSHGLIHITPDDPRLGVWIMPDNQSSGMLESFLRPKPSLVGTPLWELARESCKEAGRLEGSYKSAHLDKAHIHTYLAWIDPPGKRLQEAIRDQVMDSSSDLSQSFAAWMMNLFQLTLRAVAPP